MPLQPNGRKLLMPVETEADVRALFEKALALSQTVGFLTRDRYRADIQDHFSFIGALCPQHFRPLQSEVIHLPGEQLRIAPRIILPASKKLHTKSAQ